MSNAVKLADFLQDNANIRVLQGEEYVSQKKIKVSDIYLNIITF